ncbi:hypothetical protein MOSE0_B02080 [Monosporozyma servazzii]
MKKGVAVLGPEQKYLAIRAVALFGNLPVLHLGNFYYRFKTFPENIEPVVVSGAVIIFIPLLYNVITPAARNPKCSNVGSN